MTKIKDSISTQEELDELTEWLLNPANGDSIVELRDGVIETEKLVVGFSKGLAKIVEERVMDIVNGELEWVGDVTNELIDTFEFKPKNTLIVEGFQVNIY